MMQNFDLVGKMNATEVHQIHLPKHAKTDFLMKLFWMDTTTKMIVLTW